MTDEEINAAIAEVRGFVFRGQWQSSEDGKKFTFWDYPEDWLGPDCRPWAPNFCGDLNAMHEAEKVLINHREELVSYLQWLGWEDDSLKTIICITCATARHRAEAFLKTIGKWKD